jgi:leader peptidase (prepilin peptidase)/N-methyltransferase
VWVAAVIIYGPTLAALRVAVFLTLLLGVAITDAKHYVIPDGFTVFGLIWVLATAFAGLFTHQPTPFAGPYDALIGAFTGAGVIAVAGWLGEVALKREAMGFGDVTLMAVAGAALGPDRAILTIFLGAALGVLVFGAIVLPLTRLTKRARTTDGDQELPKVPFGVFLAPGAVIALFFGDALINWYMSRFIF